MSQTSSTFLRTKHLSKQVQSGDSKIVILRDINLSVEHGQSIAIVGASGSGKTTLLSLLAGLDLPSSGDIYLAAQHVNILNEDERASLRSQYVGFIFQSFQLLPSLTALENVMLPLEIQYIPHKQAHTLASSWLHRVNLSARLHHYPAQLSGGEQQRVAIARAFVTNPKIIFADEITGNLDTRTGQLIADILFSLNKEQNITIILVTHDDRLAQNCDRCYLLQDGMLQPC